MAHAVHEIIAAYNAEAPLAEARTIPSAWYTDERIAALEQDTVFARNWLMIERLEALSEGGRFATAELAGQPLVLVRGGDDTLRAFYNVCRHHAAAVVAAPCGRAALLRCPYHGWTYTLEGALRGTPEFEGVRGFDKAEHGLIPLPLEEWEQFAFVRLEPAGQGLGSFLEGLAQRVHPLGLQDLRFCRRQVYDLECNWKVYVDNYLDGGYHVPHAHKSLSSVLDYSAYTIENGPRFCVQSSPLSATGDAGTAAVRQGTMAYYFWVYPNFMINWYEGLMDTNVVLPLGVDRCRVVFDFYFADMSEAAAGRREQSIAVAERVQQEDIAVCESVQRGLRSRAYDVGRLSVRREAGEHLFHRLLHADLLAGVNSGCR